MGKIYFLIIAIFGFIFWGGFNINAENNFWKEKERKALENVRFKETLEEDICSVCGKIGKSEAMYKVIFYEVAYYEGEFKRVHSYCYNPGRHHLLWKAEGNEGYIERSFWDEMEQGYKNTVKIERPEIIKLFPFLRILDDFIDWTTGVIFYKVKDKRNGKEYEIYRWGGLDRWKARQKTGKEKPKYNFWEME